MDPQAGRNPMPGKPVADRRVNIYIDGYNFYVPLSGMEEKHYELCWCDFLTLGTAIVNRLVREHPRDFGGCRLGSVKYFTATIPSNMPRDTGGIERKYLWLDALHHHTQGRVEVVHGTFRPRKHRFYIERDELDNLARCGIPIHWELLSAGASRFHPDLKIHEEKQTDVMLASSLLTDAALGRAGAPYQALVQEAPQHRSNTRPTPSPCHAAVVVSADIDFLPAVEMAAGVFQCPVATAFTFPHVGYNLHDLLSRPIPILSTLEVSEEELRDAMLPREMALPDGRKIEFQKMKSSHFGRMKAMGG
jgi:hypothetical protein